MYNLAKVKEKTSEEVKAKFLQDKLDLEKAMHAYIKGKVLTEEETVCLKCITDFDSPDKNIESFLDKCSNKRLFRTFNW